MTAATMPGQQTAPKMDFHQLMSMADVPTGLTSWNVPRNYPYYTSINWFEVSIGVQSLPGTADTYLACGV